KIAVERYSPPCITARRGIRLIRTYSQLSRCTTHTGKKLKLEPHQCLQATISGLHRDLPEGPRVDVQIRIPGSRMVEYVACIQPECHMSGLMNADAFLHIRVKAPSAWPFDRTQAQRTELSWRGIAQDHVAIRI